MSKSQFDPVGQKLIPWNAGRMVGGKRPLKQSDVWAIRFYLDEHYWWRDRAPFDLALYSTLHGCDPVRFINGDVVAGGSIRNRATVVQQKTKKPVQFELGKEVRESLLA
jgi:hypothetical protein